MFAHHLICDREEKEEKNEIELKKVDEGGIFSPPNAFNVTLLFILSLLLLSSLVHLSPSVLIVLILDDLLPLFTCNGRDG